MHEQARVPALDGLRAIAIAGVLLFHVEPRIFSIGWLGVVLFFVLSGYLITGILLDSRSRPNYFRSFYARRALRIFPAYYLLLLVSAVAIYVLAPESAYLTAKLRLQSGSMPEPSAWVPFILYVQNHWMVSNSMSPLTLLLGHTWTLAIEEQFYLVWPLVIFLLSRRMLIAACLILCVCSPILRAIGGFDSGLGTSLPAQADALAAGSLLAILRRERGIGYLPSGAGYLLAGAAILPIAVQIAATGWQTIGNISLWPKVPGNSLFITFWIVLFCAILISALDERSIVARALRFKPLTRIGRVSYGIYLYHLLTNITANAIGYQVVMAAGPSMALVYAVAALKLVLAYIAAELSFILFESHFMRLKAAFSLRASRLAPAIASPAHG